MAEEIVNKVAARGLITLDLEDYYPKGQRSVIDLKHQLWQELALREKDFRAFVKEEDWSAYQDHFVAVHCSADAIVPTWAYMLVTTALVPYAKKVVYGDLEDLESSLYQEALEAINGEDYLQQRVVVKGCGNLPVPHFAYVELTRKLQPYVRTLMYGEPCSMVPLFKRARQ
ncbi:MAG: DUF2480 family protein [Salibacteraceae bacterium]